MCIRDRIGSVIVMGEKNPKGIITSEDIVFKHVAEGRGEKASDIMTEKLITIGPDMTLERASELMAEKHIKKLPVLQLGKIIGIITASDISRIEPQLYENLLETMKMGGKREKTNERGFVECEQCGNYSDNVSEVNGRMICVECAEANEPE